MHSSIYTGVRLGHMKNEIVGGCRHCPVFVVFYFHFGIGRHTRKGKDGTEKVGLLFFISLQTTVVFGEAFK